jgi:hypothetical protein
VAMSIKQGDLNSITEQRNQLVVLTEYHKEQIGNGQVDSRRNKKFMRLENFFCVDAVAAALTLGCWS